MTTQPGSDLTPRQQAILMAVVGDYIETATPVPSKTVQEKYQVAASRATIRNEMAEMERRGYLGKPHTSAGRVPTESAYQLYVSRFTASPVRLSREQTWVHGELARCGPDLPSLLRTSARLLSELTEQAALASEPVPPAVAFRGFALTPISARALRVSFETASSGRRELLWEVESPLRSEQIQALSDAVGAVLCADGLASAEVAPLAASANLPPEIVASLLSLLVAAEEQRVYVDGATRLFSCPEFRVESRLRELLSALNQEGPPWALLRGALRTPGTSIMIGSQLGPTRFLDCSLVAQTYRGPHSYPGAIAVLGPLRMSYHRAVAAVECVAREIGSLLQSEEEPEE
ncbi:MAG TPA: heat-inducible transcriptional repressor HrcA [Armatimonadota bacterium]|jgi:heat-inducible transcriptional repressor